MPEMPEVEVVRRGVHEHFVGRTIRDAAVHHPRAVRRHTAAPIDALLAGARITDTRRRGKYLWLVLDDVDALLVHLGMSGQIRVVEPGVPGAVHERARLRFDDPRGELSFVDQRTFGHLLVDPGGAALPEPIAHIAPDSSDPSFDADEVNARIRKRRTSIKRALLDQTLISGIGNIYADEALWRARLHGERASDQLSKAQVAATLSAAADVMNEALEQGGTSFDALYVNVNGASGYFDRSLNAYGQRDRPCPRCGTPIVREQFMNRSSYSCPRCQRRR